MDVQSQFFEDISISYCPVGMVVTDLDLVLGRALLPEHQQPHRAGYISFQCISILSAFLIEESLARPPHKYHAESPSSSAPRGARFHSGACH